MYLMLVCYYVSMITLVIEEVVVELITEVSSLIRSNSL